MSNPVHIVSVGGVISANKAPNGRSQLESPAGHLEIFTRFCGDQNRLFFTGSRTRSGVLIPTMMFADSDPVVSVPEPNHSIHRAERSEKQNIQPRQTKSHQRETFSWRLGLVGSGWF